MRQSKSTLASWLFLAYAVSGAVAGKRPFNIHDDLLAYPQVRLTPQPSPMTANHRI